jgi:hypothetical protein
MDLNIQNQIKDYIKSYEWEFSQEQEFSQGHEFLIRFLGEISNTEFHLIINVENEWISFTIWPYLPAIPKEKQIESLTLLCSHNYGMKLARFGITDDGVVALCIDLPVDGLNERTFHLALNVISYYADNLYSDFIILWNEN